MIQIDDNANGLLAEMVFDPQTSGGLLISVAENQSERLVSQINGSSSGIATVVGSVLPAQNHALLLS